LISASPAGPPFQQNVFCNNDLTVCRDLSWPRPCLLILRTQQAFRRDAFKQINDLVFVSIRGGFRFLFELVYFSLIFNYSTIWIRSFYEIYRVVDVMCAASRAVGPVGLLKKFPHVKEFIR